VNEEKRASDDAERERFEAWWIDFPLGLKWNDTPMGDRMWLAWQAALSARADGRDSSDARDAERYRWLRDRNRDDRMEIVNNTESDMDSFIDGQIAREKK
jgi:hypothetical protein